MKRNFELLREILIAAENWGAGEGHFSVKIDGYDQALVNEHAKLAIDAGLLEGKVLETGGRVAAVNLRGLTWAGHDFLDVAKQETLWRKAFDTVKEKGGVMTFAVLTELLKKLASAAAGLA